MRRCSTLAAVVTLAIAGCSQDEAPAPDPLLQVLAGSWVRCTNGGGFDDSETMTFSGTSVVVDRASHDTSDLSCGGTSTVYDSSSGTFVLGGTAPGRFDGADADVVARAVDVTLGENPTLYTVMYVVTSETPNLLYTADTQLDPAHDGTSSAKRDLRLNADPFVKQ